MVNGSQGIAVGMATNIPPHNRGEAIDGVVMMIDNPNCTTDDLMTVIKGPDFPTGGVILGRRGIYDAYHEGRGPHRRARQKRDRGDGRQSASASSSRRSPTWSTRSSSSRRSPSWCMKSAWTASPTCATSPTRVALRIVNELKRDVNANVVLNYLYKHTQLQYTFGAIMIALVDGEPRTLSLHQIIRHYLDLSATW